MGKIQKERLLKKLFQLRAYVIYDRTLKKVTYWPHGNTSVYEKQFQPKQQRGNYSSYQ